jgi:hypothetical protein
MKFLSRENLSSFDRKMIVASAITSTIALGFFLYYRPQLDLGNLHPVADIKEQKSNIKHKFFGSMNWNNSKVGEILYNGDEIYTGDDGTVKIQFKKTQSTISLAPRSLVRIEEAGDFLKVNLEDGQITLNFLAASTILLESNGQILSVNAESNSEFKALRSSSGVGLQLIKGKTKINNKEIKDNKLYFREKNGVLKQAIFPEIIAPKPYQIYAIENETPIVKMTKSPEWNGDLILENKDSGQVQKYSINQNNDLTLNNLQIGHYQVKLNTKSKEFSKAVDFEIKTKLQYEKLSPNDGEEKLLERGQDIQLSWELNPLFKTKVTLQSDGIKKIHEAQNLQSISISPFGNSLQYSWFLTAEKDNHFVFQTPPQHFSITYFPIKSLTTPQKNIFNLAEGKISFSWQALPNEAFSWAIKDIVNGKNEIEHAGSEKQFIWNKIRSGQFEFILNSKTYPAKSSLTYPFTVIRPILHWKKDALNSFKSVENKLLIPLPVAQIYYSKEMILELHNKNSFQIMSTARFNKKTTNIQLVEYGDYCLKVRPRETDTLVTDSEFYCFSFQHIPAFGQLPKAPDQRMSYTDYQGLNSYLIKSPVISNAKTYEFFVTRDSSGSDVVFNAKASEPQLHWISKRSGVYYFHYKVYDEKGRTSNFSPSSKLIFSK